jgi:hypothetical protein
MGIVFQDPLDLLGDRPLNQAVHFRKYRVRSAETPHDPLLKFSQPSA